VPAGTPLRGLNFVKGQNDPVAMEDHEYPAWLWDVLRKEEVKGEDGAEGDLFGRHWTFYLVLFSVEGTVLWHRFQCFR
jgi:hypothetical protein